MPVIGGEIGGIVPFGKPDKFTLYISGTDFTSNMLNYKVTRRLNQMSTFEAELVGIQSNDSVIKDRNQVMFFTGSHLELKGILDQPEYSSFGKCRIKGYGMERELMKRYVDRKEWVNTSTKNIVGGLCSVSSNGGSPYIMETGTVVEWGNLTVRGEYSNRLRVLSELAQICGSGAKSYDWYVNQSGADFSTDKFNFTTYKGSEASVKTLTTGKDCSMVDYEKDTSEMANDITVLGYGDGVNQISGTANDPTSIGVYGTYEKTFVDRSLINSGVAGSLANTYLQQLKNPVERISLDVNDYNEFDVDVGDNVTVVDNDVFPGAGSTFRVVGINKVRSSGRRRLTYELSNKSEAFAENISDTKKNLDTVGTYAKGSTDSFQISTYENCDDDTPLNMRFYIPDDVIRITDGKLSFKLKDYRAYSKTAVGVNTEPGYDDVYDTAREIKYSTTWNPVGSWLVPNHTEFINGNVSACMTYISGNSWANPGYVRLRNMTTGSDVTNGIFLYADSALGPGAIQILDESNSTFILTGDHSNYYVSIDFMSPETATCGSVWGIANFQGIRRHTHDVDFGISETTLTSPSVTVSGGVEGAEAGVGVYTADQDSIDITSVIQGAGSWTNIEFTPNKLMRIEANVFVKEFIESK